MYSLNKGLTAEWWWHNYLLEVILASNTESTWISTILFSCHSANVSYIGLMIVWNQLHIIVHIWGYTTVWCLCCIRKINRTFKNTCTLWKQFKLEQFIVMLTTAALLVTLKKTNICKLEAWKLYHEPYTQDWMLYLHHSWTILDVVLRTSDNTVQLHVMPETVIH